MTDEIRPVCADYDARVFFPHRGDRAANRYAVALCTTCPLRRACLDGALARGEKFGVWGGTTENDRARMKRPTTTKLKETA